MLRIINGQVYDPVNGIQGEIKDLYIDGDRVIADERLPQDQVQQMETIDAAGCAVMPGGVEIHSHVAGAKVNTGRIMCPEDHYDHFRAQTACTRAGCGRSLPTTFLTGYLYSALGYTTLFEAAVPPIEARHAHEELLDIPLLDTGCFTVMGNNYLVMKVLSDPDSNRRRERLRDLVSWLLRASRGYAVKVVNPGGVEDWKWNSGAADLDTPTPPFGVTPRQIITGLAEVADELRLPHPMHLHCNHLGEPGNVDTTLETMRALEGHRTHFTHLQYHSYGKTKKGGFTSGAARMAEYLNQHPEFTCDVGQIVFGPTMTMTSDAPMEFRLHQMMKGKWANCDIEMESGSGIVPIVYRPKVLVNAIQWSIGLELLLLVKDPWRIFLTTDHPNAGPFTAYPEIIRLLMDADYRNSRLAKLHPGVRRATCLFDLTREYTLDEIAVITRAGPARALGLQNKGHLGPGADADVAVYPMNDDKAAMFSSPRYVFKQGVMVVRDGQIIQSVNGRTLCVDPPGGRGLPEDLAEAFADCYTVRIANYMVEDEYLRRPEVVPCG
jgi:formylmethanofuran dehydrogenase subunit A